ncbi:hypothetical protein D0864_00424 [Hortaea werneckii]|uniref:Uncharacterized protein n=1 Tax=Hortaea werneckii TaxID=91943 RepID=A0A3M7HJY1_HORWE|nr:hypothetical protein D0864_00424 [Hortaea werneckii]
MDCRRSLRGKQTTTTVDTILAALDHHPQTLEISADQELSVCCPQNPNEKIVAEINTMIDDVLPFFRPSTRYTEALNDEKGVVNKLSNPCKVRPSCDGILDPPVEEHRTIYHPALRQPLAQQIATTPPPNKPPPQQSEPHHPPKPHPPTLLTKTKSLLTRLLATRHAQCAYCCELRPLREDFPRSWHVPKQCWKHLVPSSTALNPTTSSDRSQSNTEHIGLASFPCRACLARALAAQVQIRRVCAGVDGGGLKALGRVGCPVCRAVWSEGTLLRNMETRDFRRLMDLRAAARVEEMGTGYRGLIG